MQTRDSTVSTPRPRQAGPAICTADPGGRPPLRPKIRLPPPRPPALARKQAPNPSLTPALRRYRHGQTRIAGRNPSHFACGTADNGATPEPFARPMEAMRGLPDLQSPRPHHRHHGSRICTAGSRVPVEPPPGSRSLVPSASSTPAVRRANSGRADKANKRPHQTPVCRLPAPHATSYLTQLKELDVRCISYIHIVGGWLGPDVSCDADRYPCPQSICSRGRLLQVTKFVIPAREPNLDATDDRPRKKSSPQRGRPCHINKGNQPPASRCLQRTQQLLHQPCPLTPRISRDPKPLAQSQPMPVPSRHADLHPTHAPTRLSTSSNNATAPPT